MPAMPPDIGCAHAVFIASKLILKQEKKEKRHTVEHLSMGKRKIKKYKKKREEGRMMAWLGKEKKKGKKMGEWSVGW